MPREYHHIKQYEKEIFRLKDQGLSQRQIGDNLGIPYKGLFVLSAQIGAVHISAILYIPTFFLISAALISQSFLFVLTAIAAAAPAASPVPTQIGITRKFECAI